MVGDRSEQDFLVAMAGPPFRQTPIGDENPEAGVTIRVTQVTGIVSKSEGDIENVLGREQLGNTDDAFGGIFFMPDIAAGFADGIKIVGKP